MQRRKVQSVSAELDLGDACSVLLADLQKRINRIAAGKGKEEDVHKFRTSCRRIEAVLTQVLHAPNSIDLCVLYEDTKRARKKAGEVRDIDVARTLLATLVLPVACPSNAGCVLLSAYLLKRRGKMMMRLVRAIKGDRVANLPRQLRKTLRGVSVRHAEVQRVLTDCISESRELAARVQTPEALHRTRLSLKRLRDLAIFMGPAVGKMAQTIAARAGKLCDKFGMSQDLVTLMSLIDEAADEKDAPGELLELRARLQEKHEESHAASLRGIAGIKALEKRVSVLK